MVRPRHSDGAAAGLLPLEELGTADLPPHTAPLPGCLNPVMDVVLLFNTPPSGPAASPSQAAAPSHLSVAQLRMREMMLKRQQQAAAARAGGSGEAGAASNKPPEPTRGQPIKAMLWRLGAESTLLWSVALPRPDLFSARADVTASENEDCSVHSLAWSPDGRRVALNMELRRKRSPAAGTSAAAGTGKARRAAFVTVLDVETGALLKIVKLCEEDCDYDAVPTRRAKLSWVTNEHMPDLLYEEPPPESFAGSPLTTIRQLTPLPPLLELTSYGLGLDESGSKPGARLLPHQLRLQQLGRGGAAAPEDNTLPSILAKQWQGHERSVQALARLPVLPFDAVRWGVVQSATQFDLDLVSMGEGHPSDRDTMLSDVLLAESSFRAVHLLAHGSAPIGYVQLPDDAGPDLLAAGLTPDLVTFEALLAGDSAADNGVPVQCLFSELGLRESAATQRHLRLLSCSTTLNHLFSYLLDTLHLVKQVFRNTYRASAVDEWRKHIDELESKYLCCFELECITAIAGGRLGDGMEVMLMTEINESALHKLEESTYVSLRFFRRAAATALGPACERVLVVLQSLAGEGIEVSEAKRLVKAMLASALELERAAEEELLAAGEFYKWWKQERDKQENPRRDDAGFVAIIHDTLAACEYVRRGFMNPTIEKVASGDLEVKLEPEAPQTAASLPEVLSRTRSRLQATLRAQNDQAKLLIPTAGASEPTRLFQGPLASAAAAQPLPLRGCMTGLCTEALERLSAALTAPLLSPLVPKYTSVNSLYTIPQQPSSSATAVVSAAPGPARALDGADNTQLLFESPSHRGLSIALVRHNPTDSSVEVRLIASSRDGFSRTRILLQAADFRYAHLRVIGFHRLEAAATPFDESYVLLLQLSNSPQGPSANAVAFVRGATQRGDAEPQPFQPAHVQVRALSRKLRPVTHLELSLERAAIGAFGGDSQHLAFSVFDIGADDFFAPAAGCGDPMET